MTKNHSNLVYLYRFSTPQNIEFLQLDHYWPVLDHKTRKRKISMRIGNSHLIKSLWNPKQTLNPSLGWYFNDLLSKNGSRPEPFWFTWFIWEIRFKFMVARNRKNITDFRVLLARTQFGWKNTKKYWKKWCKVFTLLQASKRKEVKMAFLP